MKQEASAADLEAGEEGEPRGWLLRNYLRYEKILLGATTFIAVLVLWELAAEVWKLASPLFLSSPTRVVKAFMRLVDSGELWRHLRASGLEFISGYTLAALVGIPLGIALGWSKRLSYALDPLINALYAAPHVALLPLLVIWIGIGFYSKLALIFLSGVFPILMNSRDAVKTTPHNLLEAARSFKASQWKMFKSIVLPAAVPFIIAGLRLGAGRSLIGVFVAELYVAQEGVGFMIAQAGATFKTDVVLVGVVIFAVVGMTVLELLSQIERRFDKWRPQVGANQ